MWSQPWGYREAFAIPIALLVLGIIGHFTMGVVPDYAFSFPQNLIGRAFSYSRFGCRCTVSQTAHYCPLFLFL